MSDEVYWRPVVPTGLEDALTDVFPSYLREAIFPWLAERAGVNSDYLYAHFFVAFQNSAHIDLGFKADGFFKWGTVLERLRRVDDATFTNLVDFALSAEYISKFPHALEKILSDGGSAWTVVSWNSRHGRLTNRVPAGVHRAAREVLSASDTASRKLQEAWVDAYGVNPRASVAYSNAVIAVETAALSVIPAGAPEPTLSNLFSVLEADEAKWRLVFRDSDRAPGGKTLAAMLRTLWRGHESRHGRPDYADATLEEARAAVILAATLVQWFTSGVVRAV